jgi:hypothetical protein
MSLDGQLRRARPLWRISITQQHAKTARTPITLDPVHDLEIRG